MDFKFRIPTNDYEKIGVKDSDELGKLLMALSIRNYIYLDSTREIHTLWSLEITLTEKALKKKLKGEVLLWLLLNVLNVRKR